MLDTDFDFDANYAVYCDIYRVRTFKSFPTAKRFAREYRRWMNAYLAGRGREDDGMEITIHIKDQKFPMRVL